MRLRLAAVLLATALVACWAAGAPPVVAGEDAYASARREMVKAQIEARGVKDPGVLAAMAKVPRHLFLPSALASQAYADYPLPIGHGQTISQPFIVAAMTQALKLKRGEKVLEIGTGSGYQAAVLAEVGARVYTIEIVRTLFEQASQLLTSLNYGQVRCRLGDGFKGWPEEAPFDAIIVTAAPEEVPPRLVEQLRPGGRMLVPVGPRGTLQRLLLVRKGPKGKVSQRTLEIVRFVPMVHGEEKSLKD